MYLVDLRIEWEQERVLVDAAVARLIKQVRPKWKRRDMIIETSANYNLINNNNIHDKITTNNNNSPAKIAYSDTDTANKLIVTFCEDEERLKYLVKTLKKLSKRRFSDGLVAWFHNGLVEEYRPQHKRPRALSSQQQPQALSNLQNPEFLNVVSNQLGRMHREMTHQPRNYVQSPQFENIRSILYSGADVEQTGVLPTVYSLRMELAELEARCSQVCMVTVFAHNNLILRNISVKNTQNPGLENEEVGFVGWENCAQNWQGWDLAVLMIDLVLSGPEFFTENGFQSEWLRGYLAGYNKSNPSQVTDLQINNLTSQVHLCCLLYLLREVSTGVVMAGTKTLHQKGDKIEDMTAKLFSLYRQIKYNVIGINI